MEPNRSKVIHSAKHAASRSQSRATRPAPHKGLSSSHDTRRRQGEVDTSRPRRVLPAVASSVAWGGSINQAVGTAPSSPNIGLRQPGSLPQDGRCEGRNIRATPYAQQPRKRSIVRNLEVQSTSSTLVHQARKKTCKARQNPACTNGQHGNELPNRTRGPPRQQAPRRGGEAVVHGTAPHRGGEDVEHKSVVKGDNAPEAAKAKRRWWRQTRQRALKGSPCPEREGKKQRTWDIQAKPGQCLTAPPMGAAARFQMANNTISLRSLLEKEKLNGINFLDWFRNLRIVLKQERKEADNDKFKKHMDDMLDVGCLMLATMTPELQKQHEDMVAYEMIQNLEEIYEGQARQERPPQLLGMLRTAEGNMKKGGSKSVLMVREAKGKGKGKKVAKSKGNGKTKPKGKEALKPKGGKSSKRETVVDSTTKVEYDSASEATKEIVWIKKFISELGVVPSKLDVVGLYCDNNGAIAQAKEPSSHHGPNILLSVSISYDEMGKYERYTRMITSLIPLTKSLAQQKHDRHTKSVGIRYMSDWS
ncbi:hypothetical protein GQ457_12G014310 [Hibiscus cannabinus]